MSYYIPSGEKIEKALNKVLKRFRTVSSQHRLQQLVKKELKAKKGEQVGVSETRLRHIAINSGLVDLEIHTHEGDPNKILARCPVCESSLKRVKNLTIWGGQVTIEFTCPICGYWTGKKKRIPTRYIFHLKKGK